MLPVLKGSVQYVPKQAGKYLFGGSHTGSEPGEVSKHAGGKTNGFQLETSLVSVKHTNKTDMFLQTELVRSARHDWKKYR